MMEDSQDLWAPRRRHYGIAEIAEAVGESRQLVTVWRRRRSRGMPDPDDELASGPLWLASTIEPWINETRARLERESVEDEVALTQTFTRRAGRRFLRLVSFLLEDPPRPRLVGRALRALQELGPRLEQGAREAKKGDRGVEDLVKLLRQSEDLAETLEAADATNPGRTMDAHVQDLLRELLIRCLEILPNVAGVVARRGLDEA